MSNCAMNVCVQHTVDELLSNWIPDWVHCSDGVRCSRTSHPSNTPATLRSLMDITSFMNRVMICGGNGTDQRMCLLFPVVSSITCNAIYI